MPRRKHRIFVDVSTDEFTSATEIVKLIRGVLEEHVPDEFVNSRKRPTRILKFSVKDGLLVTQAEVRWRSEHIRDKS